MAGNENRKPNGQFAPKGTGDQTGGRKPIAPKSDLSGRQVGDKVKVKDTITGGTIDAEIEKVITDTWNGEPQYKVRYEDGRTFIKDERDFKEKETKVGENDSIRKEFEESKKSPSESVREEYKAFIEGKNDDLSDVESGDFVAYGSAFKGEVAEAKRRNYFIDYKAYKTAGNPRYEYTIDTTRNFDGTKKVK